MRQGTTAFSVQASCSVKAAAILSPPTFFINGEPYEGELTRPAIVAAIQPKRQRALALIQKGYTRDEAYTEEVEANFKAPRRKPMPRSTP